MRKLTEAGVPAETDVWHSDMHAFDMPRPDLPESRKATWRFREAFSYAAGQYFAEN